MTLADLLTDLAARGVILTAEDDKLIIDAPHGVITSELRERLAEWKPALLDYLGRAARGTEPETLRIPLSLDFAPSEWLAERGLRIDGGTPWGPDGRSFRPFLRLADLAEGEDAPQS